MKQRVITAIVALVLFIPILWYGSWPLMLTAIALGIIGVHEFYQMKAPGHTHYIEEGIADMGVIALILPWQSFFPSSNITALMMFYLCVMCLLALTVFRQHEMTIDTVVFPVCISLYAGIGFSSLVAARNRSLIIVLFALCIVWATDIGAYMIGRAIGKHKLAPSVSPNKTVEGSIGGILCAIVVTLLFMWQGGAYFDYSIWQMVLLSICFSIAGQLGDLVESAYKRHYGVKDSGNILPGHGGILDRFDNLLFVFPIMHLCGLF